MTEKDGKEVVTYSLEELTLTGTALTSLDLSAQNKLGTVNVTGNSNLKEVKLQQGTSRTHSVYTKVDLSKNNLDTVDFTNVDFGELNLGDNHIGALDLSNTTVTGTATLYPQTFYVSETLKNVNLAETFENFDVEKVVETSAFNAKTGVLTIENDETTYKYVTGKGKLEVTLTKANPMNRLYNPNSGEHFYTADLEEKEALVKLGWQDEGYGWVAPKDKTGTDKDVYRLYNPNAGDHHYTTNSEEVKTLVAYGWKDEGKGWISAEDNSRNGKTVPVYRQYNPFANGAGSHNYTTDKAENDYLVSLGWTPEGTAWYGLK